MTLFICVAVVSAAGWAFSFTMQRSAARRHLVLSTTLTTCLLLPAILGVRNMTGWTLFSVELPATARSEPSLNAEPPIERMLPVGEQHDSMVAVSGNEHESMQSTEGLTAVVDSQLVAGPTIARNETPMRDWKTSARQWVIGIYVSVAAALLLRLLASFLSMQSLKRQATVVGSFNDTMPVMEAGIAIPLAVGFGRPAILLPVGFREVFIPEELRDVLVHEAVHLQRGDHWILLLQGLAAAAYWPVVTVHLLNRALSRAREELCDNAVLAERDAVSYGQTLLVVAEHAVRGQRLALAPSIIGRGELERRVAALLDHRRDRRTHVGRRVTWIVAAGLLAVSILAGTTRVIALADDAQKDTATPKEPAAEAPKAKTGIQWSGIPKVDAENPTVHRGVVLGPDGLPLAGASIYAASSIVLLEMKGADKVTAKDLGEIRAVTDAEGRFEFQAQDLSWVTPAGVRKRWETLLVATKEGVAPGWIKTWGEDRTFRSHWHPHSSSEVAIHTCKPATLTGRLLLEDKQPIPGARVQVTGLMAPVHYDLSRHVPEQEERSLGLFSTVNYAETLYRPYLLPKLIIEATTDKDGRFELPGLPEGFIASIEVTHPKVQTIDLHVAVRAIDNVYRKQEHQEGRAVPTLYGSGFTAELPKGAVLRGRVISSAWGDRAHAVGLTIAQANHNSRDGMSGQQFKTDAEGRFEVTGLPDRPEGYELAFVGSFGAPFSSARQRVVPGEDARVELAPAVPYRLKLIDPQGNPIDRRVYSVGVQLVPGTVRRDVKYYFNDAVRVAPGVYEGIVPTGPAAVLASRGAKSDRPVAVNPKEFFAPGRKDWTLEEARYTYGDAWRIACTAVSTTERLAYTANPTEDQLELAAAVLTNEYTNKGALELSAVVHTDPPVEVTLVDEDGSPVTNARVERQFKKYDGDGLPATFFVSGLHPERAEFLVFKHEERGLIGTLSTTWTGDPVRVVMRPATTLIGRFVDASGKIDSDFGARIVGQGIMPDTFVAGRVFNQTEKPGERSGEFRLVVPPGVEVRGEFVRKTFDWVTRPSAGAAFGPLTTKPGETVNLGDLKIP